MANPHPYVTAAFFCERVLREHDEVLSAIRIIDRVQYSSEGMPQGYKPALKVQGLIGIKSGPVTGNHTLTLVLENPSGVRKEAYSTPVNLLGKDQGHNLLVDIGIGIEEDGLYWMDVVFDGDALTRVPLLITRLETPVSQAQTQAPT
jgi:hypothetical protein